MSKLSKYGKKPTVKPKEGIMMISNGGAVFKLSSIFEQNCEKMVTLTIEHEGQDVEVYPPYAVRDVVENVRNGTWKIVKEGPIEPEKILKQFKFI